MDKKTFNLEVTPEEAQAQLFNLNVNNQAMLRTILDMQTEILSRITNADIEEIQNEAVEKFIFHNKEIWKELGDKGEGEN